MRMDRCGYPVEAESALKKFLGERAKAIGRIARSPTGLTVAVTETKREVAGVVAGVACLMSLASLEGREEGDAREFHGFTGARSGRGPVAGSSRSSQSCDNETHSARHSCAGLRACGERSLALDACCRLAGRRALGGSAGLGAGAL